MVCAHRVNTRQELMQQILSAARSINTLQCIVRLQILWSHESENASKQMEDTLNNLLECWTAKL